VKTLNWKMKMLGLFSKELEFFGLHCSLHYYLREIKATYVGLLVTRLLIRLA